MATTFKNKRAVLDNVSSTSVYTVPAGVTAIVIGCQIANRHSAPIEVDLWWTDNSDSGNLTYLADDILIPEAAAYEPIGGKLVLEENDSLIGVCDVGSVADVSLSVLELS